MRWLQPAQGKRDAHAQQEEQGQSQAVVAVKLHLRQQITQRDTDKGAGRKSQAGRQQTVVGNKRRRTEIKGGCGQRAQERKDRTGGPATG